MSSGSDRNAFVPGFENDVFVSYAQANDKQKCPPTPGWVTTFVNQLSDCLAEQLGGQEAKIWVDKRENGLAGNKPIDEEIKGALERTAVMVMVMSNAYLERPWCKQEFELFFRIIDEEKLTNGRIFIIEYESVEYTRRDPRLQNARGYRFWIDDENRGRKRTLGFPVPRPDEEDYWFELKALADELSEELRDIKEAATHQQPASRVDVKSDDGPTVFLAEATDDLYRDRKQVVDYLAQAGMNVIPSSMQYPFGEDEFRKAVQQDLAKCDIYAQLLSRIPSRGQHYAYIQDELASAAGMTKLQWRNRDIDLTQIEDKQLEELLGGQTVMAVGIEEFKETLVNRAKSASQVAQMPMADALVRVSADAKDAELLDGITDVLQQHCVAYDSTEYDDPKQEFEFVCACCDGMIIPYAKASVKAVEERLRACLQYMFRQSRMPMLAVYRAADDKPKPGISLPGMRIVDNAQALQQFISELQQNAAERAPAGS